MRWKLVIVVNGVIIALLALAVYLESSGILSSVNKETVFGLVAITIGLGAIGIGFYLKYAASKKKTLVTARPVAEQKDLLPVRFNTYNVPFFVGAGFLSFGLIALSVGQGWSGGKVVAGILFIAVGVAVILTVNRVFWGEDMTQKWESVRGVVKELHVPRTQDLMASRVDVKDAFARIEYEYRVGGITYRSGKIALFDGSKNAGYNQHVSETYPKGREVEVWYSPTNPSEAVLEKTNPLSNKTPFKMIGYYAGCIFILIGIITILMPSGK